MMSFIVNYDLEQVVKPFLCSHMTSAAQVSPVLSSSDDQIELGRRGSETKH